MSKKGKKGKNGHPVTVVQTWGGVVEDTPKPRKAKGVHKVACYESHPALALGGGVFHGASCIHPAKGYDIYVGLDWGMKRMFPHYPWNPDPGTVEVYFPIKDGHAPSDVAEFKRMVTWLAAQLALGKKIHAGCIGGHGRTGVLMSALVCEVTGSKNASEWVRQHYCASAIETEEQIEFLQDHYGIKPVTPSKGFGFSGGWSTPSGFPSWEGPKTGTTTLSPVKGRSLWSDDVVRVY